MSTLVLMVTNNTQKRAANRQIDRQVFALAIPALGALIAEPIFLATDSIMVGHLGADSLAGLALAGALLQTMIGLMIFLAYATTPLVARKLGANDVSGAYSIGIASIWLALAIGAVLAGVTYLFSDYLIQIMQPTAEVALAAKSYFEISLLGIPAMLIVFAATGLLRGLQDTTTPLVISVAGFGLNILLNFVLIYGLNLGIAGSATGLVVVQWAMVIAFLVVIVHKAKIAEVRLRPNLATVLGNLKIGGWLFLRTVSLRIAMLSTVFVATSYGTQVLASYQIVVTLFSMSAFALDALGIAAQALIGKSLGASEQAATRQILNRTLFWGWLSGFAGTAVLLASLPFIGKLFSSDQAVISLSTWPLVVLAISLPLAGFVFVLDSVLMGAGDVKYLALTGIVNLICYLPLLRLVTLLQLPLSQTLVAITAALCIGYMLARAITLYLRARSERWMVLGASLD